jgi:hypothetical protein
MKHSHCSPGSTVPLPQREVVPLLDELELDEVDDVEELDELAAPPVAVVVVVAPPLPPTATPVPGEPCAQAASALVRPIPAATHLHIVSMVPPSQCHRRYPTRGFYPPVRGPAARLRSREPALRQHRRGPGARQCTRFWPGHGERGTRLFEMSTTVTRFSGILFLLLSGCGAYDKAAIDPRVASQVTLSHLDPPPGCAFLGVVKGYAPFGVVDDANTDVIRSAVLRGGNFVAVDLIERPVLLGLANTVVHGRLFACPSQKAQAAVAMGPARPAAPSPAPSEPPAPRACDPECAPGFTCQLGACVASPPSQAAAPAN